MEPDHATNAVPSDWKPESETCCNHCLCSIWTGSYFFEKEVSRWVLYLSSHRATGVAWILEIRQFLTLGHCFFFGLAYQGKGIIVFRFIIEYNSLRDFYRPLGNNNRSIFI